MCYVIFGWKVKQHCLTNFCQWDLHIFLLKFYPQGFGRLSLMIIKMQPQHKLDWARHKSYKQDGFCKGYRTVRWLSMHNHLSFHLKSIRIGGNMQFLVKFFGEVILLHFSTKYHIKHINWKLKDWTLQQCKNQSNPSNIFQAIARQNYKQRKTLIITDYTHKLINFITYPSLERVFQWYNTILHNNFIL